MRIVSWIRAFLLGFGLGAASGGVAFKLLETTVRRWFGL